MQTAGTVYETPANTMNTVKESAHTLLRHLRTHWPILLALGAMMALSFTGQRIERYRITYFGPVQERSYSPIAVRWQMIDRHDEVSYLGGATWLADGNWRCVFRDTATWEYRESVVPLPILTMTLLALLVKIAGGAEAGFVLAQILSNALAMLVVYVLVYRATGGRLLPTLSAILLIVASPLTNLLLGHRGETGMFFPISFIFPQQITYLSMNYSRIPFNGLTFPWLAACVAAFAWMLEKRSWPAIVTAGVLLGVQPMTYPYFATSWLLGLPVIFLWLAVRKDWPGLRTLMATGGVAVIAAFPALLSQWEFMKVPHHADYYEAISYAFEMSTAPMLIISLLVLGGSFLIRPKGWSITLLVTGSVMLGATLSMLMRHVTGYDMQIHHWNHRVFQPMFQIAACLGAGYLIRQLVNRKRAWSRWRVAGPVLAGMLAVFAFMQMAAAVIHTAYHRQHAYITPDERAAYDWLAGQDTQNKVVLALSPEVIHMLRPLTGSYSYLPFRHMSMLPNTEVEDRWVNGFRFYGVRESFFDSLMHPGLRKGAAFRRGIRDPEWSYELVRSMFTCFHLQHKCPTYALPDSLRLALCEEFRSISNPDSAMRTFHADYVWQGAYERSIGIDSLERNRNITPVFEQGDVRVYRVAERN